MAILANDANDLTDQLILLTRRLTEIALTQAKMFEADDFSQITPLNDEAARLSATYTIESARIARNPKIMDNVDKHLIENLKKETKRFRETLAKHESAIERGKILAEGLVKAIAHEAAEARPTPQAYSPNRVGGISGPKRDTSAIALDRRA